MIDTGKLWKFGQDTRVTPRLFYKKCHGIFNDHRESGPRLNIKTSERCFFSLSERRFWWHYPWLQVRITLPLLSLSKAPNPQLLPGCRSINGSGCVFMVCVYFGWVNCRARIPSMGNHTWLYVTFTFTKKNWKKNNHNLYFAFTPEMYCSLPKATEKFQATRCFQRP